MWKKKTKESISCWWKKKKLTRGVRFLLCVNKQIVMDFLTYNFGHDEIAHSTAALEAWERSKSQGGN